MMPINKNIQLEDKGYYAYLSLATIIGFVFLLYRSRLGVDLTDDAWYTADPYWVAKGSIPYVNNWTQASGFTLPLFIFHSLFLKIFNSSEGIILFSRIVYCAWKASVVFLSFLFLRRATFCIPAPLATVLIVFTPLHLYAINYNTIGVTYLFLCFSLLAWSNAAQSEKTQNLKLWTGIVLGCVMGRSIIGTPVTIIVCFCFLLFLLFNKQIVTLKGYVAGGIIAFISVVFFCCARGGIDNFIVGLQYYFKDLGYYDSIKAQGLSLSSENLFLFKYALPAMGIIIVCICLRFYLRNNRALLNKLLILVSVIMLVCSLYYFCTSTNGDLLNERSLIHRISGFTRYGWFVPIVCAFGKYHRNLNKRLRLIAFFALISFCVFVFQGYVTIFGMQSRTYWNFSSVLLAIYSIGCCADATVSMHKFIVSRSFILKSIITFVSCLICLFAFRSACLNVYRDLPTSQLTTEVSSGVWKGCYTTKERATTVMALEKQLKSRTTEKDDVLCWGIWSSFLNLLYNGNICSASPLGTGGKNGFDFWHMHRVVPTKVFVHVDENDIHGILTNTRPVWAFITQFYKKTDEIRYVSYDTRGAPVRYRILEYQLVDFDNALNYADQMATKVTTIKNIF